MFRLKSYHCFFTNETTVLLGILSALVSWCSLAQRERERKRERERDRERDRERQREGEGKEEIRGSTDRQTDKKL